MKNKHAYRFVVLTSLFLAVAQSNAKGNGASDAKNQACDFLAQNSKFFAETASDIHSKLVAATNQLSTQARADLHLLQSMNASQALKSENGAAADDQRVASDRLASEIRSHFNQPDDLDDASKKITGSVTYQRDLYSYCLNETQLKRPIVECVGGGNCLSAAYCQSSDGQKAQPELSISQIWVSNVKHPTLTLSIYGADYKHGGQHLNIDIDLTKLEEGQVSSDDLFKLIWPFKDCLEQGESFIQSSNSRLKNLSSRIEEAAEQTNTTGGMAGL